MASKIATVSEPQTFNEIMNKAAASALRGGVAGAAAMGANVACLMWMRTTVSYILFHDVLGTVLNQCQIEFHFSL